MVAIQVCANVLLHALSPKSSLCLIPEPVSFPEVCSTVLANPNTSDDNRLYNFHLETTPYGEQLTSLFFFIEIAGSWF